jgi:teichuronic acid exporter
MSELSFKTTQGMLWSLAENLGLYVMQFVVSIILARLLLPEQFGLIGMLTLFMALAQSLLDSGFGSALIRKKDASQLDTCSVFYFNLVIGIGLTLLLWLTAPLIASFYSQPVLTPLTRFLSLNLLINSFRMVPSAVLTRRMDFKAMFKISLVAVIVSGGAGVGLAAAGYGVWSLAVQSVLDTLIRMFLMWRMSGWRPAKLFSLTSLKSMFAYGSRLLFSGLLDTFFNNIYQLFIGKVYSAADLGYYVRAQNIESVAVQPTGGALGRVMFPALASIQDDRVRMKQAYRKIITTSIYFHFPLMIGLLVVSGPLITLLMTPRWAPSVPYLQLFCLVGLPWPLHVLNLNILTVTGRSDLFLRLEVAKKVLVVVAIAATYPLGITALLYGQIATSLVSYVLNSYYSGKLVDYSMAQQVRDWLPYLLMSIGMGITMYFVGSVIAPDLPKMLVQVATGTAVYLALDFLLGHSVLREALQLIRSVIQLPKTV